MSGSHHSPEVRAKRMRIWKHNTFQGHCSMADKNLQTIIESDSVTDEARKLAAEIREKVQALRELIKVRVD